MREKYLTRDFLRTKLECDLQTVLTQNLRLIPGGLRADLPPTIQTEIPAAVANYRRITEHTINSSELNTTGIKFNQSNSVAVAERKPRPGRAREGVENISSNL